MSKKKRIWGLVFIGIGLVMAIRSGRAIWRLSQAGGPLVQAQEELKRVEQENLALRSTLSEVESPGFIEKEARNKLGYGRDKEVILILPRDSEAGPSAQAQVAEDVRPNWKKWWDLYIRI